MTLFLIIRIFKLIISDSLLFAFLQNKSPVCACLTTVNITHAGFIICALKTFY